MRLARSGRFRRRESWKNVSLFSTLEGVCGFRMRELEELKDTVTLRHRDSMEQERLPIGALLPRLLESIR